MSGLDDFPPAEREDIRVVAFAFLSCPSCGEDCESLPAHHSTDPELRDEFPDGYWTDGDKGVCRCGAAVQVWADGEAACLVEAGADDAPSASQGSK